MDVYWLEQTEADVPQENNWLAPTEFSFLGGLRFADRRSNWRLGRWTAKCAVALRFDLSLSLPELAKIEVRPAPSGAPEVFWENKPAAATISLSHRNGRAICAVAPPAVELGCDLELIEQHSDAFVADYFTAEEQALVAARTAVERPLLLALLWSAKESALKALREGLRLDTRCMIINPGNASAGADGWSPLGIRYTGGRILDGWWQSGDGMVRTMVTAPPAAAPVRLKITSQNSYAVPQQQIRF
jgi:4'-phosphopantetheinyl transferase